MLQQSFLQHNLIRFSTRLFKSNMYHKKARSLDVLPWMQARSKSQGRSLHADFLNWSFVVLDSFIPLPTVSRVSVIVRGATESVSDLVARLCTLEGKLFDSVDVVDLHDYVVDLKLKSNFLRSLTATHIDHLTRKCRKINGWNATPIPRALSDVTGYGSVGLKKKSN